MTQHDTKVTREQIMMNMSYRIEKIVRMGVMRPDPLHREFDEWVQRLHETADILHLQIECL